LNAPLARRWWLSALAAITLAGCATPPAPPAKAAVNLTGFTPDFRAGYGDGCASVNAARRRDEARYKADVQYAQGWRDGYDVCRRRQ
jgi:hypothetical protein